MQTKLDTPYVYYEIKNRILYATYKKGVKIDLSTAKKIVETRLHFMNGKTMPVIVFYEGNASINKAARDFFATEEGNKGLTAGAIILDSPVASVLGNFFLLITKPSIPAKTFADKSKALMWLSKFVN